MKKIAPFICLLLAACASPEIKIDSSPSGANILSAQNEVLGQSPLVLKKAQIERLAKDDLLFLTFEKEGHEKRQVLVPSRGFDEHSVKLTPIDKKFFNQNVLVNWNKEVNELVADILTIQGLMVGRQTERAKQGLEAFEKKYPNIAAAYIFRAQLAELDGQEDLVRKYLQRAQKVAPQDPVVRRLLKRRNIATEGGQ